MLRTFLIQLEFGLNQHKSSPAQITSHEERHARSDVAIREEECRTGIGQPVAERVRPRKLVRMASSRHNVMDPKKPSAAKQIGRASGRERMGQYVKITVVN